VPVSKQSEGMEPPFKNEKGTCLHQDSGRQASPFSTNDCFVYSNLNLQPETITEAEESPSLSKRREAGEREKLRLETQNAGGLKT